MDRTNRFLLNNIMIVSEGVEICNDRLMVSTYFFILILGLAINGKVDFAINDFGYTQERGEVAKFLEFNEPNYGQIYIRNPKETYDWLVYTKPLTTEAWTGIMIFTIFAPLFLVVLDCKKLQIIVAESN